MLKNTEATYGSVAKTLHWLIAIAVLMMLVMGLVMEDIPNPIDKFWVYSLHKSMGITVLVLMCVRLAWKLMNRGLPHHNPAHKPWEQKLAAAIHWGFYGALIAMPLSGWLMTGAFGSTISWFGFFPVPNIAEVNKPMAELYSEVHTVISYIIWTFLALHVGGALKHAVIDRDNTLRRILPFAAVALMLLPFAARAEDAAEPINWRIDREQSTLGFEATQEGSPFKGVFKAFDGSITFDPKTPEKGKAHIIIDMNSADSGNPERDTTMKEPAWFDINTTPTATYAIDNFEKDTTDGQYIARGRLIMRGIERSLDLPFKLLITEKDGIMTAHAIGEVSLNRVDYGVGDGQWADPKMIGTDVIVKLDLIATAKKQEE